MPKRLELAGKTFGYWEVLYPVGRKKNSFCYWLCKCKCSNEREVASVDLTMGRSVSCGCYLSPNLIGMKFGKLTVIEKADKTKSGSVRWLCRCDCGNLRRVRASCLTSGASFRCNICGVIDIGKANTKHGLLANGKNQDKLAKRAYSRFMSYGITTEAIDALMAQQNQKCPICARDLLNDKNTNLDHDHKTKQIRGILCGSCNRGIGLLGDDPIRLLNAVKYLLSYGGSLMDGMDIQTGAVDDAALQALNEFEQKTLTAGTTDFKMLTGTIQAKGTPVPVPIRATGTTGFSSASSSDFDDLLK